MWVAGGLAALATITAAADPFDVTTAARDTAATLSAPRERVDLSRKDRGRVAAVTRPTADFAAAERFEARPGGAATTTARIDGNVFSHPSANLTLAGRQDFFVGNGIFKKLWVSSPSSTAASDGLGPLYNARACQRCHLKDGRGHPPSGPDDVATSMLVRLSVPPATPRDRQALASLEALVMPEPTYGGQLQDFAVPSLAAEGRLALDWVEHEVALAGGESVRLRAPVAAITDLSDGPLAPGTMVSLRIANPMIGLGLLEAIHPADILANADPDDADDDGISGRASVVRDPRTGALTLGRFGWKATAPSVEAQSAAAFSGDIGISSALHPDPYGECTGGQAACRALPTGVQTHMGDTEITDEMLDLVTFYSKNLAVPARRDVDDPAVLEGKRLFYETGCASCHTPKFVTGRDALNPEHRFQLVWPYTDMLLHDMGEGLADDRPVGTASGREWRTPPLWGVGLTQTVNGHDSLLHDGRARGVLEAVLWHGGEAQAARDKVVEMTPEEREALVRFVESL
ncbi:MAG: di-heme oxidoredictase family protein [Acuticoccus sp.]